MLSRRLIVCLDVKGGRVVKGVRFEGLRDVGDPVDFAAHYEAEGADEIVYLDITASAEKRNTLLALARRTAERLFIPLTIGGGIRTVDDVAAALRAGADQVGPNSAAVRRPEVLSEGAERFGTQCIVASIDAKWEDGRYRVYTHGGRTPTNLEAADWAAECVRRGAGEILLTSIDRDGSRDGYDLALTRTVADAVTVPVIASGGAGNAAHVRDAIVHGGADVALVAGILHARCDGGGTEDRLRAAGLSRAGGRVNVAPSVLMEAALEVARTASLVALRYYKRGIDIETKSDGSPVTLPIAPPSSSPASGSMRASRPTASSARSSANRRGRAGDAGYSTRSTAPRASCAGSRCGAPA